METTRYSDLMCDWLKDLGYDTCFFVAGGNNMHLLNSARSRFRCVPVVHEVSAAIAAEYYTVCSKGGRAFALVTAGPGITNAVTGVAGAWLESRELLVLGGQVKSIDLRSEGLRQRGIQEIDGKAILKPICKQSEPITDVISRRRFEQLVKSAFTGRKGPVFLEVCLDVQGRQVVTLDLEGREDGGDLVLDEDQVAPEISEEQLENLAQLLHDAERPVLLLGGGLDRVEAVRLWPLLDTSGIPIVTTWNGADRYPSDRPMWFGRSDTWGMRFANLIVQQADLLIAVGARLSLQQTGFNWESYAPAAKIIHVNNDPEELGKAHPLRRIPVEGDAAVVLEKLLERSRDRETEWMSFCSTVKTSCPLSEQSNSAQRSLDEASAKDFLNPFDFALDLSRLAGMTDIVVPCSSGGAFTVMMQAFLNRSGQRMVTNKALASMGYGLAGAIGAALAEPTERTILVEGDGGFAQNMQELATANLHNLNLKIFIFSNHGYASIRMTQRNHFGGSYIGCDVESGLGFPEWAGIAKAFGLHFLKLGPQFDSNRDFLSLWNLNGPVIFEVPIDPEQTYYPKISSMVKADGSMTSSPLHKMDPPLPDEVERSVLRFIEP